MLTILLPYLSFLLGAGSGWLTSWAFDQLRDDWLTRPTYPAWLAQALDTAVYKPLGARVSVFVLTVLVGLLVSAGVTFLIGRNQWILITALTALVAVLLGQLRHGIVTFGRVVDVDFEGDSDDARDSNP